MGLSELEDLQRRYTRLEQLYSEAVRARDEAIEERDKATVVIALQLESETEELNKQIETLQSQNKKLYEENEDLKIRLSYTKDDINKLQQRHIALQLEQEKCLQEKEDALALVEGFKNSRKTGKVVKEGDRQGDERMESEKTDPAYSSVRDEIFTSASEKDLELEPRPPVTIKKTRVEDAFDVHEEVGKGKFGVVKKVTERSSKTVFAAKYIRLGSTGSGSSREDIMREINIMNQLHHKRLVGLVDAFDISRNIVMIMEFVSGGELFERVADADCLTEREGSFYMYQLLQGLQYMHMKNIVHLDLKPENIVCVSKDSWDIKLIDFGLAVELVPGVRMTALKGTPEFMAPEAVNFETISFATDMWSVGVIAYILLSGLSPLLGEDVNETLSNVTAAEWDFEDESFDVISDEAKDFIGQLLMKNAKKRNTVKQCLEHDWMKKSASANAVKIDTKKLKQFLAKRRWQKSVNALVAVRRLSSLASLMNVKSRPSSAPSLATVASANEEEEEEEETADDEAMQGDKEQTLVQNIDDKVDMAFEENNEKISMQPPIFSKELSDTSINEGETVSFKVGIENDSNCHLEWLKNGVKIAAGERFSLLNHGEGGYSLTIRDTQDDDSGEYHCVVENEAGRVTCGGKLSVESQSKNEETDDEEEKIDSSIEVPVFAKELHDVIANEHDAVTLEVIVSGNSAFELEWFKNAVDVTESERISLVNHENGRCTLNIRDCEDDDTGEYCCVAQNEAGRVTCAGWLTVEVESVRSEDDEESEESEDDDVFVPKEFVKIREGDVQTFYCIEEEVGRGRFGIVKKCVELDTATRFCAKFIKSRPSQKEEFKREIDVMNSLHHPRIIRLQDAFEEQRQIILIMEYARGGDLFARIDGDSLPEFEAVKILKQVLDALKYMHDLGFMHLDLKPQNVMFKNEGGSKIKLIDFSLTRKFDPQQETKISFGTAEFVAPEIVNYEPVTLSADMWAIGVIAYIMLSGESPFLGDSEADTFSRITEARWEFSDVFDYVSKEAKDFISRLLLKDPKKRLTVEECLGHEWIESPGFTGKQKSKNYSEGELAVDANANVVSPTERKRQESRKSEEQDIPFDAKKLESKLKTLLSKLQNSEKENQELEEKLRDEEERADTLEDELRTSENSKRELEEKVLKLDTEKIDLSKKAKANSDVLKRVAETEGEKRTLEDKLSEQTKYLETLSQKYDSLKEKIENYDVLEEKVYLLERERKESRDTKQHLEEKIERFQAEKQELTQMNETNTLVHKNLENEISKLRGDRDRFENQYVTLRSEKESLVEEMTKRFGVLEQEKNDLEKKLKVFENENKDLKVKLDSAVKDLNCLKETAKQSVKERDVDEMESELTKIKKENDEVKKTCEDLASKLSKAYAELEQPKPSLNNDGLSVLQQEEISTLQEKVTSLEKERDSLEDDLDEREAEIDELIKKIEQLGTDSKAKDSEIQNYKANLDSVNEEVKILRSKFREAEGDFDKRVKDCDAMVDKLAKEVSVLQGELSAANQKNKDLEEKVKAGMQVKHGKAIQENEIVVRSENQLQNASMSFDERPSRAKEQQFESGGSGQVRNISLEREVNDAFFDQRESERNTTLKKDFDELKMLLEVAEMKLAKEREKTRALEDEVENFEMEKRRGLKMYQELNEECNRLREELNDNESSQSQVEVRLREKLRTRLKNKEEEIEVLSKQFDSLRKEAQVIKEERDKGNTLYVNLAEKYKNLLKENKSLEQEKQERDQKDGKSRELEDSLQIRIQELMQMKDEIESMRDNVRVLMHEKGEGMREYTSLQKDLAKLKSDRQQLEEQIQDEMKRADKLEKERSSLQGKVEEMRKDLNKRDLVAAADKKTINTYADEIKVLKDEKGNAITEVEKLTKQSKKLLQDLERMGKEREEIETLKMEKHKALKEIEILRSENKRLVQKSEEFDQIAADLNSLREEKVIGVQQLGILRKENEDQIKKAMEDVEDLKIEKENVLREIETLRSENQLLLQKMEHFDKMRSDFNSRLKDDLQSTNRLKEDVTALKAEKQNAQKAIEILTNENELLLQKVDQFDKMTRDFDSLKDDLENTNRLKENIDALKTEKENAQNDIVILTNKNELLLQKVDQFDKMRKDFERLKDDLQNTNRLKEDVTALKTEKENVLKKIEILTNENDHLLRKLHEFDQMREDLDKLRDEKVIGLRELDILKDENEALLEELRTMKQSGVLEENNTLKEANANLLREQAEIKRVNSDLRTVANEKEKVSEENETLRKERETLMNRMEKLKKSNEDCSALREDKLSLLKELDRSKYENETLLQEFEYANAAKDNLEKQKQALANDFERTREHLQTLKTHNENQLNELDSLKKENEALLAELKSFQSIKTDLKTSIADKQRLQKNYHDLEVSLENQALEAMRLKKETTILKKKNEVLTKELQRLQNNKSPLEKQISTPVNADLMEAEPKCDQKAGETAASKGMKKNETNILQEMIGEAKVKEEKTSKVKEKVGEVEALKEEIGFLQNEVEDLSEEHKQLLQSYNVLQKEKGRLKEELSAFEKCMETKSKDLEKIMLENAQVRDQLRGLEEEYDSQKLKLEHAEREIQDFAKENEELHQNHIDLEGRYGRIRKLNRELEEDVDIERKYHAEVKSRNVDLKKENAHLRQHITKLHQEVDKLQEASKTNQREQGDENKKAPHLEKKKSLVQLKKEELQARVAGEKPKSFGDENRKPKSRVESVNEHHKAKHHEDERTMASLEKEINNLRSSKERTVALEKQLEQLQERLDFEVKNRDSKDEELKQKKKESDSLIYELESTRHRLVSNVLNPLEEANLPWALNVTAADIFAGKNKGKPWSNIKENIVALIRDRERLTNENMILQQAYSRISEETQETSKECEELTKERRESIQSLEGISEKDILTKKQDLNVLHNKIAADKENLASIQNRNKQLLFQIELMKQMQHTADEERGKLAAQKNLFVATDKKLAQLKLRRFQSVENVSTMKHKASLEKQDMGPIHEYLKGDDIVTRQAQDLTAQAPAIEEDEHSREEQLEVARELVKKNRQIFELEQEVDVLLAKIEESSCEKSTKDIISSDVDNFKLEILRLEGENSRLKELANDPLLASSQKKIETLEAMNNFLKREKEELVLDIAAKNKKIEILERRVKELTEMRTSAVNGSKNGVCDEADEQINELDEELRKTKHKVAELEAELDHSNNSYNSRLRRELDEIEAKWTKRLRKECMELQSELSEKHNKDKQQWQKKEVELQNIIRQMKIVMDKRLGQAEVERRRLEQLVNSRSSSFHGSTVSLDSNSDDSGETPSPKPETSSDMPQPTDCLSDRELRRVAYKLNGEEWSQLGTFLGVGDKDLVQLGGLSMGPQEKAFRLLCVWRTRCRVGRSQMISQLAVSLEEVNRKDVAQFVLEQFMSGKPRKKFFGW